jgi:hypothetical protein
MPTTQLHELVVDDATYADLEQKRVNKLSALFDMTLDRQLSPNSHLPSSAAAALLGLKQE